MRAVSPRLLAAVTGSHTMCTRARVCTAYQTGTDPTGTEIPILGGDVQANADADVRGTLTLTTHAEWGNTAAALLAPYGNEIYVERGVDFGGTREWVGLGYYRVTDAEQDDAPHGTTRISGADRMHGLVEARLVAPQQFTASATIQEVFEALVLDVYPAAVLELDADIAADPLGRAAVAEEDRHGFLKDLATARGKVMFWDYRGALKVTDPPDPAQPLWTLQQGAQGTLVTLARSMSRERMYNAVVATGEGADTTSPVRAVVVDANPLSPTLWGGRFGKKPRFYSSPFITTDEQAASAATKLLGRAIGLPYSVTFAAVPNPALEPLDPGHVVTAQGLERHILSELTIPLTADAALTGATREQTSVQIGPL